MKDKMVLIFMMALAFTAIGCADDQARSNQTQLWISADRLNYTPLMSSTVGIGLAPAYPPTIDNRTVSFRWQADYGFFLSWGPPDFKVHYLESNVTIDDRKIYWSYSPEDMGKEKPAVHITLSMVDKASGRVVNVTGLEIGWENGHVATVKK